METIANKLWAQNTTPSITVITPVFNRRDVLQRTLDSVERQTTRDFEYIIVNDGSTQNIDDIVTEFMDKADFPVLYLKKENGGVHTARNAGIRRARGEMLAFMDSDDEFTSDALEMLLKIWREVPGDKSEYLGVRTPVVNERMEFQGQRFPKGINDLSAQESYAVYKRINAGAEHYGFRRRDIMQQHPWPEPENVTFVTERILWDVLEKEYRYYYTNYVPRIYHTEDEDSYIRRKKKNLQALKNRHWNACYLLNRPKVHPDGLRGRVVKNMQACCFSILIKKAGDIPPGEKLVRLSDRLLQLLMYIPGCLLASVYSSSRMK